MTQIPSPIHSKGEDNLEEINQIKSSDYNSSNKNNQMSAQWTPISKISNIDIY